MSGVRSRGSQDPSVHACASTRVRPRVAVGRPVTPAWALPRGASRICRGEAVLTDCLGCSPPGQAPFSPQSHPAVLSPWK